MYILSLFGGVSLEAEGSPLGGRIVQRRRLALLALLASSRDRPFSRDKLIACLWPESGASQARHSLSDSLHVIHKALGESALLVEGDELRLSREVFSCDVWQFEAALEAGDLERAVRLYAGPFLDGFYVGGDSLEFDAWAASERERLARSYQGTLERLAESAAAEGDSRRSAEWWRRLCTEDPDNSRAVLGLMKALAAAGDRAGALQRARAHVEHLKGEYGAEPDPTLTAFVRRLQEEPGAWTPPTVASGGDGGAVAEAAPSRKSMRPAERSLATILFTDIVSSTERAAELRDAGWRELRQEHDRRVRRLLRRFGGREINTAGDSFLAAFERPAGAIACAAAIRAAVRELRLEIRAGLHMGEVEGVGRELGGLALNIGARVAAAAGPGEILVSRSVHDALAGSAFDFEDRGVRTLKGVPGEWRLFAVTGVPAEAGAVLPGRLRGTFARRREFLGAAVGAVLVLLTAFYVTRRQPESVQLTPEEALATNAAPGIAILPFTVSDPALVQWREGMVDLLSVNLDGVPDLRAIDNRTVLARWGEAVSDTARADLATALAVAHKTGARYALLGTVVTAGADLRLTADVYEVKGGTRLGQGQVTGAPDSMLGLVDRLSMEVLRALPREGSVLADVDLAELTTDSLAALKAYLNGETLYRRADFKGAGAAYERAIASDSMFALAWHRLFATCGWSSGSELCPRDPPGWPDEYLSRLPARRAEMVRAGIYSMDPVEAIKALHEMVRKYPDDPEAWYQLGDVYTHNGGWLLVDRAEGDRALERAIALAPTTSAEPYIHLIEHAFADADSARVARLLDAYEDITRGAAAGYDPAIFRLAFALGFGDSATRAKTNAALDTVPTSLLLVALNYIGNPRLRGATEEAVRVALARPDNEEWWPTLMIHYRRGNLRGALEVTKDPVIRPAYRAAMTYRLHQVGMNLPPDELERILAAGAADTTAGLLYHSTYLLLGAYAADREQWDQYGSALDRQRARARYWQAEGNALRGRSHEGAARALEGYALWKRGQKVEAVRALESAQQQINGNEASRGWPWMGPNVTVRWWLGELMLELGRLRDAERYFKSISAEPFAALRLARVYENLGKFEKARASYEYALLSWQDADPELQPRIQEARRVLARLPKPLRRESP